MRFTASRPVNTYDAPGGNCCGTLAVGESLPVLFVLYYGNAVYIRVKDAPERWLLFSISDIGVIKDE
jgi:hypothetical protein